METEESKSIKVGSDVRVTISKLVRQTTEMDYRLVAVTEEGLLLSERILAPDSRLEGRFFTGKMPFVCPWEDVLKVERPTKLVE